MHQCSVCSSAFSAPKNLYQHMRRKHNVEPTLPSAKIICPLSCSFKFRTLQELRSHLASFHEQMLEKEELDFPDFEAFEEWKRNFELTSGYAYICRVVRHKQIKSQYICHRSGVFKSSSTGKRKLKKIGSNKIGFTCPSVLEVSHSLSDKKVHVLFWKTHVGHDADAKRISLKRLRFKNSDCITFDVCAVLPAAGIGERMGLDTPKQYVAVHGKPVICYTVEAFLKIPFIKKVIVVVASEYLELMLSISTEKICIKDEKLMVTNGYNSRHQSIESGLRALKNFCDFKPEVVVIHDGVRPFFSEDIVCKVVLAAKDHGAAGVVCPLVSTVISVDDNGFLDQSLDRNRYRASEMPQAFQFDVICEAYSKSSVFDLENGTECLHLVQKYCGIKARIFPSPSNLWKITYSRDIYTAAACVKENQQVAIFNSQISDDLSMSIRTCLSKSFKEVHMAGKVWYSSQTKFPNVVQLWSNKSTSDVIDQLRTLENSVTGRFSSVVNVILNTTVDGYNFFELQKEAKEISKKLKSSNILVYFIIPKEFDSTESQEEISKMASSLLFDSNPFISGSIFIT